MKQVVVVHGGDSFSSYGEYRRVLKNWKISLADLQPRNDWKANLQNDLGRSWQVIRPTMPNKRNAQYAEWSVWFNKCRPFIRPGAILIGHSLGGIFLAKYLSEHPWPKNTAALILVAAPHNHTSDIGNFRLLRPLRRLSQRVKKVYLYHSEDDRVVPVSEIESYAKAIPGAIIRRFKHRGHFSQAHFPELVHLLKTL